MSIYKREGSPFYHYDFEWNGSRHRGSTKQKTEQKARLFEAKLMAQLDLKAAENSHVHMPAADQSERHRAVEDGGAG